jgi:hypothetical protein
MSLTVLTMAFFVALSGSATPAAEPARATTSRKPNAEEVDVFILTGQSNMLGTTAAADAMPDPGDDPGDAATRIFWSNVSSSNDAWPPRLHGDSGGGFVPLAVQQGDGGKNVTFWGPEFGLARELAARGGRTVAIIKACRGGGGNSLWDKATFDRDPAAGHMWGHLRDTLEAALDALAEGDAKPRIRGFCYLQGESNSAPEAQVAGERLAALVRNVAAIVEKKSPGATRGMRVAVAEIAASQANPRRVSTTAAQQAICARAPNAAFVPTADLPLKKDGIHFGGTEKLEIGRRLAAALMPAAKARPANVPAASR